MIINSLSSANRSAQNNSNRKQSFGLILFNKKTPEIIGEAFENNLTQMAKKARKVVINGEKQEVEAIFKGEKSDWFQYDKVSLTVTKKTESANGLFDSLVKSVKKRFFTKGKSSVQRKNFFRYDNQDHVVSNLFERGIHDYVKKAEKKAAKLAQ